MRSTTTSFALAEEVCFLKVKLLGHDKWLRDLGVLIDHFGKLRETHHWLLLRCLNA